VNNLLYIVELKNRIDTSWKPEFVNEALDFFERSTMSIELLKDGELQKCYFHVRDKVSRLNHGWVWVVTLSIDLSLKDGT